MAGVGMAELDNLRRVSGRRESGWRVLGGWPSSTPRRVSGRRGHSAVGGSGQAQARAVDRAERELVRAELNSHPVVPEPGDPEDDRVVAQLG